MVKQYCHECGAQLVPSDVYCSECGTKKRPLELGQLSEVKTTYREQPDSEEELAEELVTYASQQVAAGVRSRDVVREIVARGIPSTFAGDIDSTVRKKQIRGAEKGVLLGMVFVGLGVIVLAVTYSSAAIVGGKFVIPIGLFVVGVIRVIVSASTIRRLERAQQLN